MLRAAKVFTKVTWAPASASLLLLSLWLLLLASALGRCRSSCRCCFSSRRCSLRCLLLTWKRRPLGEQPARLTRAAACSRETRGWRMQRAQTASHWEQRKTHWRPKLLCFPFSLKFTFKLIPLAELANKISFLLLVSQFKMTQGTLTPVQQEITLKYATGHPSLHDWMPQVILTKSSEAYFIFASASGFLHYAAF